MKVFLLTALLSVAFIISSCSDSNENEPVICPQEQWGETMRGDGEELGAYPDLFSNYWAYTYDMSAHPETGLCIKGVFPNARYFSFSLYNDETGSAIGGINDAEIVPDEGCDNPFVVTSAKENRFTIYVVPATMSEEQIAKLPSRNICRVEPGVNKLAVCIRHYLGTDGHGNRDEFGGVELPRIMGVNINTLQLIEAPQRIASNIDKATGLVYDQRSDQNPDVPFFLALRGQYYPNNSTSYLYARTHLSADSLLIFSFIPVPIPQHVEQYATAKARYWSVCLGSAANTRSYYSVYDGEANAAQDEKATFIVCLKKNPRLSEVQDKVDALNKEGRHCNLFVWDSEKPDVDGKPIGEVIVVMYRNILPDATWEHSIARMTPTNYKDATGEPIDHVTDPSTQLAHEALGNYGPYGHKYATFGFLSTDF